MAWRCLMNSLLGLWLVGTALLHLGPEVNFWNDLIVGILFVHLGFWIMEEKSCPGWTSYLVGLWLIIAAFIPPLVHGDGVLWNNLIVGLAAALGGLAGLGEEKLRRVFGVIQGRTAH